jgi:hypothetical protein
MKKLILFFSLCLLSYPALVSAVGTIQLVDFSDQVNAIVGHRSLIPINFLYSGDFHAGLGISIKGLPSWLEFGSIIDKGNGYNTINIIGNPEVSGKFNLTLILTDNNGALLTRPFSLIVSPNNFNLPNAVANQSYSQYIPFDYTGDLSIIFSAWQNGVKNSDIEIIGSSSSLYEKRVKLDLVAHKTGQFIIRADLVNNSDAWKASTIANNAMNRPGSKKNIDTWKEALNPIYSQTFYLTVINSATIVPSNPSMTDQQSSVVNEIPVSQTTNTPPVEKNVIEESDQLENNVQDDQEQNLNNDALSPVDERNQKKAGFFQPVSNFFKNIFKSIGNFFIGISK